MPYLLDRNLHKVKLKYGNFSAVRTLKWKLWSHTDFFRPSEGSKAVRLNLRKERVALWKTTYQFWMSFICMAVHVGMLMSLGLVHKLYLLLDTPARISVTWCTSRQRNTQYVNTSLYLVPLSSSTYTVHTVNIFQTLPLSFPSFPLCNVKGWCRNPVSLGNITLVDFYNNWICQISAWSPSINMDTVGLLLKNVIRSFTLTVSKARKWLKGVKYNTQCKHGRRELNMVILLRRFAFQMVLLQGIILIYLSSIKNIRRACCIWP